MLVLTISRYFHPGKSLDDLMQQSVSICTGLHAFDPKEYLTANDGWTIEDRLVDPCFIAGLS